MPDNEDLTPVRKQYLDIKRQHQDAILFFRLGDFYETFDKDAEIASRELEIVLTSRKVAKGKRVPMAGIPHHAAENYIARLIERGYHVAICEQIGDGPVKGLFPREVVRMVTPGTVLEPGLIPGDANNYLAAVVPSGESVGLAYVDITTGEFAATEIEGDPDSDELLQELVRLNPAEVLLPDGMPVRTEFPGQRTEIEPMRFQLDRCQRLLQRHFGVATLDGFGLQEKPDAIRASGVIVDYLGRSHRPTLELLTRIRSYSTHEFMVLDRATRRNLELTATIRGGEVSGSLLSVLDENVTPMGRRILRQWLGQPLLDPASINARLDRVAAFSSEGLVRAGLRQKLAPIGDLERLTNRAIAGMAQPRDLVHMRDILRDLPAIKTTLLESSDGVVTELGAGLDLCQSALDLLERAITDEPPATLGSLGVIAAGFDETLDQVHSSSSAARQWISDLESVERVRTGIKSLKVGFNKVFGYYIEVTKANIEMVPDEYIRKQTLVNAERYITPEMKEYESRVLSAEEEMLELERKAFERVCRALAEDGTGLLDTARRLGELDTYSALAEIAATRGYVRPELVEEPLLDIRAGRHPVVERFLEERRFVPNDSQFEKGERIRVITGPNMSGKSTYLRQTALLMLMAQIGSFVPAERARIGVADRIFTRIGAQDEIHSGQSTFMVEMVETANILHHATDRSLLILDEIGRGTSTYDGLSIAWAVIEYLHNHPRLRPRTLFATHYHELTSLAETLPGVRNYNIGVTEENGRVVFLHRIMPGGADRSYGIHVGELAGLPRAVVQRAQELLLEMERKGASPGGGPGQPRQTSFMPQIDPFLKELEALDLEEITPLEALNKLYQWQRKLGEGDPPGE